MKSKKEQMARILLALAGIVLVGIGISFNAASALGNDPIGIVYDGIRNAAGLSSQQLGMASNITNIILLVIVFFTGRRYVNIGTLIYLAPYGLVVSLGGKIYPLIFRTQTLFTQICGAAAGCLLLYTGVAMFIAADIGLDPFTGLVMVIQDAVQKQYRTVKIIFDVCCVTLGFLLGGKLGIITIITALAAGPLIQLLAEMIKKFIGRRMEFQ
ncbi:MAG: hypothetical protein HFI70_00915 [Lachnospiraceae bacterium]|nr:hypothetical protein [Lachnospiraceae bacterium]